MLVLRSLLAENTVPVCELLVEYLNERLEHKVTFAALQTEPPADITWMCGLLYIKCCGEQGLEPLCAPVSVGDAAPHYHSKIIVHQESRFQTLSELEGARLVINERASFSGCQVLYYHLGQKGLASLQFAEVIESGSHLCSIHSVLNRQADVAAIDNTVFDYWCKHHPAEARALRVLDRTEDFPMPPIVVSKEMDAGLRHQLKTALLTLPEGMILEHGFTHFQPVDDVFYSRIRNALDLGILPWH